MKTKAFSYLRVSGKSQIDGDGFPRQREVIAKYGAEVVREFVEEGVSGTKEAFDRAAMTELLEAIKGSDVRLVLIERADRLARDLMVSEILLTQFRKLGVKVVSAECGTDLTVGDDDPTRKLIRQVLGALSEWEKSSLCKKLRAARCRVKSLTGRCEGRKPYGRDDSERYIIKQMFNRRAEGFSFSGIAEFLNGQEVKPRSGVKWHPAGIRRIMFANRQK